MNSIDLNCDVGEFPEAIADGSQKALLPFFTSVNIACGGHAGDESTMRITVEQAQGLGIAIGAHPSYPDREHFGRVVLRITPMPLRPLRPRNNDRPIWMPDPGAISADALADSIRGQVTAIAAIAAEYGARVTHVKPHGALYNEAARNGQVAEAIARGVAGWDRRVTLVGLADSPMLEVFARAGFAVAGEAFADRRYEPDGTLRSRTFPDALIGDPSEAARQALSIAQHNRAIARDGSTIAVNAQTICVHSDTPGAAAIAAAVRETLRHAGIAVRALSLS